ncbi:kelch repeat-containing protein [Chitinophaga sp. GCM10012297]|uniref:Uncharacterized protein n=1 Tax=Chitinophaga chungangae TaxID=2821488 RepID=A0ABS3YFT3_9BACT|nr:kelch repeat-containing protein [Chitinophaga chungangae]MBO9153542.1 hypothetical protein [Chitinophaga chungangae]
MLINRVSYAQPHGLIFSSFETVQEKRTSLDLGGGAPVCLSHGFSLSFDISFLPGQPAYFGYVFRLINREHQNIDLLYSPNTGAFNLVTGERLSGISFRAEALGAQLRWARFRLVRNGRELAFYVDGKLCGKAEADLTDDCFHIIFGACNFPDFRSTDLPPMQVRNVLLEKDGRPDAFWPLREISGNTAVDSLHGQKALVTNGTWAAALHLHWQPRYDATVKGHASVAFDAEREELIVVAKDSIYRYAEKNGSVSAVPVTDPRHQLLLGSHSFLDPVTRELWQFNIDHGWAAVFRNGGWLPPFDSVYVTEYWQANRFYAPSRRSLYFLGGYGQYRYKNRVCRYNFDTGKWDTVRTNGDSYTPRYLAALGAAGDTAYILGGFGSTTGEQMLNPRYLYDFLQLDGRTGSIKKLFTLPTPAGQFVFGNSMVIDTAARRYYALIFPNDRYDSRLQLIRGSLDAPGYTLLADTIPFMFKDTRAFAGLFYCAASKRLLAVTTFTKENRHTEVKAYAIGFPPEKLPVTATPRPPYRIPWWYYIIGLALLVFALLLSARRRRQRKHQNPHPETRAASAVPPENQAASSYALPEGEDQREHDAAVAQQRPSVSWIFFFGNFTVKDAAGQDLTRQFTPLLKELFLLIAVHTFENGQGISVEKLSEILWNDKSDKAAKNNRSVNILKLKNILEKLGGCALRKESGNWRLDCDGTVYIDLRELHRLAGGDPDERSLREVLYIVMRGAFLYQTEYEWLDDFKSAISGRLLDRLSREAAGGKWNGDPELLIAIANGIFVLDPVNEQGLAVKCRSLVALGRHSLARHAYERFVKEYRHIYGEEYPASFGDILH